jgi:hypothetical protein
MVPAVDARRVTDGRMQVRRCFHAQRMTALWIHMVGRRGMLARQVLVQRAAHGDVDQLDTATDREYRQSPFAGGAIQGNLDGVASLVGFLELGVWRFPVARGMDVLAARQYQTPRGLEGLPDTRRIE